MLFADEYWVAALPAIAGGHEGFSPRADPPDRFCAQAWQIHQGNDGPHRWCKGISMIFRKRPKAAAQRRRHSARPVGIDDRTTAFQRLNPRSQDHHHFPTTGLVKQTDGSIHQPLSLPDDTGFGFSVATALSSRQH
jgi:hypothetical protein